MRTQTQRTRKAQTEVLGLAIVIILIMVGILFVVKFTLREQPSEARATFTSAEIASNLANSLLETSHAECHNIQLRTLLQDCAKAPEDIDCDRDTFPDSCDHARQLINDILTDTLIAWERPFVFNITVFPTDVYLFQDETSGVYFMSDFGAWVYPENTETTPVPVPDGDFGSRESKIFTVPLNPGEIFVRVDLYS